MLTVGAHRTLVVVEGDAVMNQYQDAEGKNRSSLSIYQRMAGAYYPLGDFANE